MHGTINSDEHDAKHGVRSGPEQPLAQKHREKPGASSSQQYTAGKSKGESMSEAEWRGAKRAGVQRRRTVSTDLPVVKEPCDMRCVSPSIAAHSPERGTSWVTRETAGTVDTK